MAAFSIFINEIIAPCAVINEKLMQFAELAYTDGKISEEMYRSVLCANKNGYHMQDYLNEHLC